MRRAFELTVYVEAGCHGSSRAREIAMEVRQVYPHLSVRLIDIARASGPAAEVFAVPTFVLNGEVVSLGNPRSSELRQKIDRLLAPDEDA